MKYSYQAIKALRVIILFLLLSTFSYSQLRFSAGGYLGGGTIKGNSPSIGAFTASAFIETNTSLFLEVTPRLSYFYAKDFNAIIPNTSQPYNPYIQGINIKGITTQYFKDKMFLEEGVGLLALNDRTFSDTNVWSYGIVLSISGGWDLRGFYLSGFKLGGGVEFGITFNNTLARYSVLYLIFNYTF
ncbi:MAG: hypothetical protein P8X73_03330 [Ignavibacteriaceae bacterium]